MDLWGPALGLIAAATVCVLPTMLLALVAFDGTVLAWYERLGLGLGFALVLPPALVFLEFQVAGLPFSRGLVIGNAAVIALSAVALAGRRRRIGWQGPVVWVPAALLAIVLIAFALRFATASPTFSENDPYFYTKVTERLVRDGAVETFSPEAYAPRALFLRVPPLMHYCTAGWYAMYEAVAGAPHPKETLIRTAQLLPPLAGALVAFLGFLLVRRPYGDGVGLAVAAILTVRPEMVEQFAAGRSDQQPYGLFTVMLVWALYALAHGTGSPRLIAGTAVAAGASVLGSQHHVAALVVLAAYAGVQAIADYVAGTPDRRLVGATGGALAGVLAAGAIYASYTGGHRFRFLDAPQLGLSAAFALTLGLYLAARMLGNGRARLLGAIGLIAVGAAIVITTPLGARLTTLLPGRFSGALAPSAVALTITEQQRVRIPFGVLAWALPASVAMTALAAGVGLLVGARSVRWAVAVAVGPLAAVLLADVVRRPLAALAPHVSSPLREGLTVVAGSPVWIYLLAAVAVLAVDQLRGARPDRARLLLPVIVFPLAYLGLEQAKFTPHLGVALALALGILFGEYGWAARALRRSVWAGRLRWPLRLATIAVVVGGLALLLASAVKLPRAMAALAASQISPEWVALRELAPSFPGEPASATGWLHRHLNRGDPAIQARCRERFGWECRVLGWWDPGHWITFFGETNVVLDGTNEFEDYVRETARALVEGPPALERAMRLHRATHVVVSAEVIAAWHDLTFLAGSCSRADSELCPAVPEIDWHAGMGRSRYEREHAYEYLSEVGLACELPVRAEAGLVMQSRFGTRYCVAGTAMRRMGAGPGGAERRLGRLSPIPTGPPERDTSYLIDTPTPGTVMNVNPDASDVGHESHAFDAAFTRLFFFEDLPGFRLVFRSPRGTVKIFEHVPTDARAGRRP